MKLKTSKKLDNYQKHKMSWTLKFALIAFSLLLLRVIMTAYNVATSAHTHGLNSQLQQIFDTYMLVSAGSILLLPIAAYVIGSRQSLSNEPLENNYNGTLIALLASGIFAIPVVLSLDLPGEIGLFEPAIMTAAAAAVALSLVMIYNRSEQKARLLNFAPFKILSILIFSGTLAMLILGGIDPANLKIFEQSAVSILQILIVFTLVAVGAKVSKEPNLSAKITDSLVPIAIAGWIYSTTLAIPIELAPEGNLASLGANIALIFGFVTWAAYIWFAQYRAPKPKK